MRIEQFFVAVKNAKSRIGKSNLTISDAENDPSHSASTAANSSCGESEVVAHHVGIAQKPA